MDDAIYYPISILVGIFLIWLANWNMKREDHDDGASNFKYWLLFIVGILSVAAGAFFLVGDLIAVI